ncbi:MAG TPA: cob(I)yrinic acid a,c-diamide adenosyltransferase [Solirubrobacteraceae bacterium]|jgi:cob(I)alamin adenosyltransferase|nr:cob(I)yrinic acid a,c-diamide adenosyltransferase [Solirubrobacteraceae bacterium]
MSDQPPTRRPAGYVASCSLRGAAPPDDPDDAPIERPFSARAIEPPIGDGAALARNTAAGVDVPHRAGDRGTAEPRRRKPRDKPLVIVVTGDGKGKSTAAFGMLLRSWSRDYRCGVVQFIKSGRWKVGEQRAAEALGGIDWMKTGDGWSWISRDIVESADLARAGWDQVKRFIADERYEFLLLDEFTYPLKWGWVDVDEVVGVLRDRPGFQHVVITGRGAPQALIDAADLVSEVTLVRHPIERGIRGQQGIEW